MQTDNTWFVRNEDGKVFGPCPLETLVEWARDGRISPSSDVSCDRAEWIPSTQKPELDMTWLVEVSPRQYFGPVPKEMLDGLVREGSVPAEARRYRLVTATSAAEDAEAKRTFDECVQLLSEKNAQVVSVCAQLDTFRVRVGELERSLQEARAAAAAREAELKDRDAKVTTMRVALRTKADEAQKAQETEKLAREELKKAAVELKKAMAQLKGREALLAAREKALEIVRAEADEARAKSDALEARMKEAAVQADEKAKNLSATAEESVRALQRQLETARGELAASEKARVAGEKALAASEKELAESMAALESREKELADGAAALEAAEKKLQLQTLRAEAAEGRVETAEARAKESERTCADLRARLDEMDAKASRPPEVEVVEPEVVVVEDPAPRARRASSGRAAPSGGSASSGGPVGGPPGSLAAIEAQAQRELARMKASGRNFFGR